MSTMSTYSVEITEFRFPATLNDEKANFRLQVDLRYRDADGKFGIYTVILPGIDLYWECSRKKNEKNELKSGYHLVRKGDENDNTIWYPEVDFGKVGPWGKRFRLHATQLYELRVTVFDVARKNWIKKMASAATKVFKSVTGALSNLSGVLKPIVDETVATIGRRIDDNDDKILVVCSGEYTKSNLRDHWSFKHENYEFKFVANIESD